MSFLEYLKINKLWLINRILIIIILNSILISSLSLNQGIDDVIYLNILIAFIEIITIFYGYISHKKYYHTLFKNIEMNKKINRNDYFSKKIEKAINNERSIFNQKEFEYREQINELQEYITQWVHDIKINISVCNLLIEENGYSNELKKQIEQINFKVNLVLQVTRAVNYSKDFIAEDIEVIEELKMAVKENAIFFINKNIEINKKVNPFTVVSDKKWIRYILSQILNNCSKYTPINGCVTIFMQEDDKGYYLHIRDNGEGIPAEDIDRIFDKGFTGKNGRKRTKSTGMGLYYSKKMADNLSIGLRVESEEYKYTEFVISFYKLPEYYKITKM